jgi:hypothetical protein
MKFSLKDGQSSVTVTSRQAGLQQVSIVWVYVVNIIIIRYEILSMSILNILTDRMLY